MATDFLNAHRRHMDDAEFLFQASRLPNADQLFGFAVECGLKSLMSKFGMPIDANGEPTSGTDRKHADMILNRYEAYRSTNVVGANYALASPNHFQDWHASQRYAESSDITPAAVQVHRAAAASVATLVRKAVLEGLI
jgi:hypothetical protein